MQLSAEMPQSPWQVQEWSGYMSSWWQGLVRQRVRVRFGFGFGFEFGFEVGFGVGLALGVGVVLEFGLGFV